MANIRNGRWQKAVTAMAALVVFVTTYMLILPALTLTNANPKLEADRTQGALGDVLSATVTAEVDNTQEEQVFLLRAVGDNAGLDESYAFDENDITVIADLDDNEKQIELHRQPQMDDTVDYWFTLPAGGSAEFPLTFSNGAAMPIIGTAEDEPADEATEMDTDGGEDTGVTVEETAATTEDADESTEETEVEPVPVTYVPGDQSIGGSLKFYACSAMTLEEAQAKLAELPEDEPAALDLVWDEQIATTIEEQPAEEPTEEPAEKSEDVTEEPTEDEMATEDKQEDEKKPEEQVRSLTAEGSDYSVKVTFDADAKIPENAELTAKEYQADGKTFEQYQKKTETAILKELDEESITLSGMRLFDVEIRADGKKIEPEAPVDVHFDFDDAEDLDENCTIVHFADAGTEVLMNQDVSAEVEKNHSASVDFTLDSFSMVSIVYTVDFHYEVNGKMYDFSLPGGGFVSFKDVVQVLGIATTDENGENSSETADAVQKFVDGVEKIEFSTPELLSVSKVQEDTTVGAIKERLGLECEYSAELTEEQIAEINAAEVAGGDWALISLKAFDTEETLTVTMKNREVFTVKVTDAQSDFLNKQNIENKSVHSTNVASTLDATNQLEPEAKKTLEPNGDGTYTLTLSVKAPISESSSTGKANIVIVYDSSSSMHEPASHETVAFDPDPNGAYWYIDGKYVKVAKKVFPGKTYIGYQDENGNFISKNENDPRFTPKPTRMDVAKDCIEELGNKLFNYNTSSNPDTVQVALVEYATTIKQLQQPTTEKDTFTSWVDSLSSYAQTEADFADIRGGTNWEQALTEANKIYFGDEDPTYIIFISDGIPTARISPPYEGDGTRIGDGLVTKPIEGIYGNGNTDPKGWNFDAALKVAQQINQDGKKLYTVGIFGEATNMQNLLPNAGYIGGTDREAIKTGFANIISNIASSGKLGYTDVTVTDGITSMTSSTVFDNRLQDFMYKLVDKDGNELEFPEEQKTAKFVPSPNDDKESGQIKWELGKDYYLIEGATYSVSFVVWPDQHSYDLVSDLNNGLKDFNKDLTPEEQSQVESTNGGTPYKLKTNTFAEASFTRTTEVEGEVTDKTVVPITLKEPDPMPLTDSQVTVQKVWNDSLDTSQLEDLIKEHPDYKARLSLQKESADYITGIEIGAPSTNSPIPRTWPELDGSGNVKYHHISAGLMVSTGAAAASGLNVTGYPSTTYNGITYYILETGHDYSFAEASSDYHFELEDKTWHPMVVDGKLQNVTFDGNTVKDIGDLTTLTATNSLKGGIQVYKKVYDDGGNDITSQENRTKFSITVTMKNPDGSVYAATAAVGGYRIYYGSNNPAGSPVYDTDGTTITGYGRSDRVGISGGTFTVQLYAGDYVQVANVDRGVTYEVTESTMPAGYELKEILYNRSVHTMTSNTSHQVEVKNVHQTPKTININIKKTDNAANSTNYLTGAVFELNYRANSTAVWVKVPSAEVKELDANSQFTVPKDGITLNGLTTGQYRLKEVTPPAGYVINELYPVIFTVEDGAITGTEGTINTVRYTAATSSTDASFIIPNTPGVALPNTGGPGTLLYYILGTILTLGAGFVMVMRLRKRIA